MLRTNHSLSFKNTCPLYPPEKMATLSLNSRAYREVDIHWNSQKADEVNVRLGNINREAAEGGYCGSWEGARSLKYSVNEVLADGFSFNKSFTEENDSTLAMANTMLKSFVISLSALVTPSIIVNDIRTAKKSASMKP